MFAMLDGQVLPVDSGAGWTLLDGTSPHVREIIVPRAVARALIAARNPNTSVLRLDAAAEGRGTEFIRGLTIFGPYHTDSVHTSMLELVDRRWSLPYTHVHRAFNVRRRSGERRRVGAGQPLANQVLADDLAFASWSLRDGKTRWTGLEALNSLMTEIFGIMGYELRGVAGIVDLPEPVDLEIDGTADAAIAQLLAELGGALAMHVSPGGKVIVRNRLDDRERLLVGAGLPFQTTSSAAEIPAMPGRPVWSIMDRALETPALFRILFERLIELRLDFDEFGGATISRSDPLTDKIRLTNVLPSPEDFEYAGRKFVIGQLISFPLYLGYLAGKQFVNANGEGLPDLSLTIIRDGWTHACLDAYAETDTSGLWGRRIDAIRAHYRLTFQIDEPWRSRIRELRDSRVAVEDTENGIQARALVISDYSVIETWRSRSTSQLGGIPSHADHQQNRFANVSARGGSIIGTDFTSLAPAPAQITELDAELGVVRIEYSRGNDMTHRSSEIIRSAFEGGSTSTDLREKRELYLQEGRLAAEHEVSIILAAVLGAPSGRARYHAIELKPDEVLKRLPTRKRTNLAAKGPPMDIRIPAATLVARYAWDDSRAAAFFAAFGPAAAAGDLSKALDRPINEAELLALAEARAAAQMTRFLDRAEGGLTTALSPNLELEGAAGSISHEMDPRLGAVTSVDIPRDPEPLDYLSIVPPSVRKVVKRLVDPGP